MRGASEPEKLAAALTRGQLGEIAAFSRNKHHFARETRERSIAKSVVRPDIPTSRPFRGARGHVRAAFMSDIHVGSRTFLEDKWSKVSEWLAGDGRVDEVEGLAAEAREIFERLRANPYLERLASLPQQQPVAAS